jgi:hypothetical protein
MLTSLVLATIPQAVEWIPLSNFLAAAGAGEKYQRVCQSSAVDMLGDGSLWQVSLFSTALTDAVQLA